MEKKTVCTIWGIYGLLAIAGSVRILIWYKRFLRNLSRSTAEYDDEETE